MSPPLTLEIVEGPGAGQTVTVADAVVIGRDPGVDVTLHDERISRRHARLTPAGPDALTVQDLGSSNGTFINHNPVYGAATLHPGDELLIGVTLMQIRRDSPAQGAQPSLVRAVPPALAVAERRPNYVEPAPAAGGSGVPELDALVDARTKQRARYAPIAVFALVVLVVLLYFATR